MSKHEDHEEVMVEYASSRNISFRDKDSLGITWGEWREMSSEERDACVAEYLFQLVDVTVVGDED